MPMGHTPPVFDAHVAQPVVAVLTAVHNDDVYAPPVDHVPAGHKPVPDADEVPSEQYLPAGQGRHVAESAVAE